MRKKITRNKIRIFKENVGHKIVRVKQLQNVWNENNVGLQGEIVLLALNNALCFELDFSPLQVKCKHHLGLGLVNDAIS